METSEKALNPALSIRLNNDAAADLGISVQRVGATVRPLLAGETPGDWRQSHYYQYYEYPAVHSVHRHYGVRTARHKLIHFNQIDEWELYDLEKDPREMHSVYDDPRYAAVVHELKTELDRLLPYVGLLCRDDALERGNTAAGLASSGALTGLTLAFAGGNIGTGPGWWVVLFCAGLATAALLLLWMVGNGISRTEEAITIDRDLAAGWRALGFFVGGGLIVGRAVAGDWSSVGGTLRDFARQGWMVVVLTAVSVAVDQLTRPTPEKPAPNVFLHGLLPCLLYLAVGIVTVMRLGSW